MRTDYDIWVDFMSMRDDRRLWTRLQDARSGFVSIVGQYAVVGSEEAFPAVTQIVAMDIEGGIQLLVLDGDVEEHRHLLTPA